MDPRLATIFGLVFVLGVASGIPVQNSSQPGNVEDNEIFQVPSSPASIILNRSGELKNETMPGLNHTDVTQRRPGLGIRTRLSEFLDRRQEQIGGGVNTIVSGARGMIEGLEKILRGSFSIPYNAFVRSTSHGVLNAIFGTHRSEVNH